MTAIGVHHNTLMTGAASVLSHTPFYMKFFQLVNEPAAYIVAHIVVYNWVSKLKNSKLSYAYLLVSMLNSLLVGERSGSTNLLLALIILYIFIRRFAFGLKIKGSIIIKIAAVLLLLLIGFQQSLLILGRRTVIDQSLSDYLAFYMGGEVKNLDYYLNSGITNHFNEPFLAFTFSNIYNLLGGIFGSYTPPVATRFLSVNGFRTGNVASMLYPFYCDGGLFGVIALSAVVGFIVQSCYEIAKRNVYNTSISLPLYSIFALSLAMSFFSNRILGSNLFVAISCIAIGPFIFRFITDNRRKINLLH
jgi:oligosaccharide repeat unit polymerase